jgi:hypothetical protein
VVLAVHIIDESPDSPLAPRIGDLGWAPVTTVDEQSNRVYWNVFTAPQLTSFKLSRKACESSLDFSKRSYARMFSACRRSFNRDL